MLIVPLFTLPRTAATRRLLAGIVLGIGVNVPLNLLAQGNAPVAAATAELPTDPASVLAVVGETPILMGELQSKVESRIQEVLGQSGQKFPEDQLKKARADLTRSMLASTIQTKMLRESFLLDQVGTQASDKRAEADEKMKQKARQMFLENEVTELFKQYKTEDLTELDNQLRAKGTSLVARQREFADSILGHLYMREKVNKEPKVSIAEIVQYYEDHRNDFYNPERSRWEQLSVYFSRVSSPAEAQEQIAAMGKEAYFGGNMQAVARQYSHEPFAAKGGLHEWTARGALASEAIDQQIFSLPIGRMSEVIQDELGLHILRVLDRKPAGITPLSEVQDQIRTKIREEKVARSQQEAIEGIRDKVAVWSIFPEDVPGAKPLPPSIAQSSAPVR
jgi:parvulin-like peptidyl-prolyl isomerase